MRNISRLLVFKLGSKGQLPPPPPDAQRVLDPPPFVASNAAKADAGASPYQNSCSVCHGDSAIAGGLNPDLRHSSALGNAKLWQQIVHDGLLSANGMVAWKDQYNAAQIENIRQFVIRRANEDKALEAKGKKIASR